MSVPRITVEDDPDPRAVQAIEDHLNRFNIAVTGYDDYRPLAVFLRGADGGVLGGLTGYTWGGCLKIAFLWLPAEQRGQGYGARLLEAAERVGRERGCRQALIDTHTFQAPDFYQRAGYTIRGEIEDAPVGHAQVYLSKRLS
ncbi:MAG TPA: GNAT family N-acetyltransferase [Ktedonobacterales bacterium]|jgi:GNAT superfamily N-acetyltransferase